MFYVSYIKLINLSHHFLQHDSFDGINILVN